MPHKLAFKYKNRTSKPFIFIIEPLAEDFVLLPDESLELWISISEWERLVSGELVFQFDHVKDNKVVVWDSEEYEVRSNGKVIHCGHQREHIGWWSDVFEIAIEASPQKFIDEFLKLTATLNSKEDRELWFPTHYSHHRKEFIERFGYRLSGTWRTKTMPQDEDDCYFRFNFAELDKSAKVYCGISAYNFGENMENSSSLWDETIFIPLKQQIEIS